LTTKSKLGFTLAAAATLCFSANASAVKALSSVPPSEPDCEADDTVCQLWLGHLSELQSEDLGYHEETPPKLLNRVALTACMMIRQNPNTTGEDNFIVYTRETFPDVSTEEHEELFDAAMEIVCPDLGFIRGYEWSSGSATGESPTEPLPEAEPGTPGWHFVSCEAALGIEACDEDQASAYANWGERLPYLYYDPEGTYVAPYVGGGYTSEDIAYRDFNRSVLDLCDRMDNARDIGEFEEWYEYQAGLFPLAEPVDHMLLFHHAINLVCVGVELPTEDEYNWEDPGHNAGEYPGWKSP
jgi:hypothetical protein